MNPADFQKTTTPGRLEPTTFRERVPGIGDARQVSGMGYVPHPLPAGLTRKEVLLGVHDELVQAERDLALLEGLARSISNPAILIGPFARKEAKHSSAIENTFASEEQLALFDIDATSIEAGERAEVQDVSNYLAALHHGYYDNRPICLNLIKEMHSALLTNSTRMDGRPGEFRTTQNAIGNRSLPFTEAKFVPPPPAFLGECLGALEKYIHADDDMPALVRLALAHYQFECIHPFDDGNGRIGRLLVTLQLAKQKPNGGSHLTLPLVYISGFLDKHRDAYYDLLYRVSGDGAWIPWIRFFLVAISTQALDAQRRAQMLDELRTSYLEKVQKKRASAMLPRIINELFSNPAITVARAQKVAGVSQPSAGSLIRKLVEAEILKERTGRKHYRVYVATELLKVMTRDLDDQQHSQPQTPPVEAS